MLSPFLVKALTVWELWQLHKTKRDLRKEYLDHWQATIKRTTTGRAVDAVISPAVPYAATPHGKNSYVVSTLGVAFSDIIYGF